MVLAMLKMEPWKLDDSTLGRILYPVGMAMVLFGASYEANLKANKKIIEKLDRIEKALIEQDNLK
nr:hypothetical protein [uncultured Methanoregula sp.]